MATAFNLKDFITGLGVKIRGVTGLGAGSDEALPAHMVQDSAGNEILGKRDDVASNAIDNTSVSFMSVFKAISAAVQGALTLWGAKTDAANTATNATPVSIMQVIKQISASIQALATAFGAALTRGLGASDANTQRVVIATDQLSAPATAPQLTSAGYAPVGLPLDYGMPLETSKMLNGNTVLTPKFAPIAASSSGVSTAIAAVSGKKLRVLAYELTANGAVNANLQSHSTTSTKTGITYCAAAGDGKIVPFSPVGWFETVAGEALDINLSGAVAVGGQIVYVEV